MSDRRIFRGIVASADERQHNGRNYTRDPPTPPDSGISRESSDTFSVKDTGTEATAGSDNGSDATAGFVNGSYKSSETSPVVQNEVKAMAESNNSSDKLSQSFSVVSTVGERVEADGDVSPKEDSEDDPDRVKVNHSRQGDA
ncbi:uncharacterized protein I206_101494 [Kwoniella pini CBS 10737]|uniref:Uncharacterized protein n=1 Tax=Kwoniella pini CBS 10737 TaxID=1296096 RepID=A0A1B9HWK0_9TREE|nr:uncharacterized protein I206_06533 [Kwoniella pini CBS 10737]OCF47630.1 hypothetical protein I206_06533 [Kwoniella pini CBS 10737]